MRTAAGMFPHVKQEDKLFGMVADSIDRHHTDVLVNNLVEMTGWDTGLELSYASLFSGALDATLQGLKRAGFSTRHVLAAEREADRRRVLNAESRPCFCFGDVTAVANAVKGGWRGVQPQVLAASPPCKKLSPGNVTHATDRARKVQEAVDETTGYYGAIMDVAEGLGVAAVMIEQTAGMKSHHPRALEAAWRQLERQGWRWRFGKMEASDLGAAHARARLGWVGVCDRVLEGSGNDAARGGGG